LIATVNRQTPFNFLTFGEVGAFLVGVIAIVLFITGQVDKLVDPEQSDWVFISPLPAHFILRMMEQLLHYFSEALDESEEVTGVLNLDGLSGLFDSRFGKYLCHKEFQFPANSGQFPANSLPIHC
jgi:hypothetical protein